MGVVSVVILSVFAVLLGGLDFHSRGEAPKRPRIYFSLPYEPTKNEKPNTKTFCLADSFKAELDVVLVSEEGNCVAKTANAFMDEYSGHEIKATRLIGTGNCLTQEKFHVAVIGVDPSAIHIVEAKTNESSLPKDIELKARRVARSGYRHLPAARSSPRTFFASEKPPEAPAPSRTVASPHPDVFRIGNTAFLLFKCTDEFFNQDGLPVLVLNNNAFLLKGSCAFRSPFFFAVNEKLHVAYWATLSCCGCGDSEFFFYDLSGESPRLVHQNWSFSD